MPDRFPLAYSTLGCPEWTLEHAAAEVAKQGYVGLEIRVLDGEIIRHDLSAERRREIRSTMDRHGLQTVALGLSTRFSSADADERRANLEQLRAYLELANDLEAPMVRTYGGAVPEGSTMDEAIERVSSNLAQVMPKADEQGVDIVIETHDEFCLGHVLQRVLAEVNHPRLGIVWDFYNSFEVGEPIERTWESVGAHVKHIHFKDGKQQPDGHWTQVMLGEGQVPGRKVIELLHGSGYGGCITIEWEKKWHPDLADPEVAMPENARVIREWMAELE